jgi:N-acetylglucosaminyl-diphospho-decaprenol L-rhamnosyltransferase
MNDAPVLSIVIVNSDGTDDTLHCLESIERHPPHVLFEVIVVDNLSQLSCLPFIQQRFPSVRTFLAPLRQGFAKNYNLGIRQACGQYILVLNNDTLIQAKALDALLDAVQSHSDYGMVGPQLQSPDGQLQTVCARSLLTPFSYMLTLLLFDLGLPTGRWLDAYRRRRLLKRSSGPAPCLSGACMLFPRITIDRIGLLDEDYDFYFEDVEWCHRVQKFGLKTAYIAEAPVTHLGDQSLSKVKVWAKQSEYRSALRYFRQYYHIGLGRARFVWLATVMAFLLRFTLFKVKELITRRACYASEYAQLVRWIWSKYPAAVYADDIALAGETRSPA